jgi:hypothetical protein
MSLDWVGLPCRAIFYQQVVTCVGFEVLTVVTMKTTVTPCSMIDKYQSFWGICCLNSQGRRDSYSMQKIKELVAPKRWCLRIEPHCVTFQKTVALKSIIFWNGTPYSLAEIYRRCEELNVYIFSSRINRTRKQKLGLSNLFSPGVTVVLRWNCGTSLVSEIVYSTKYNRKHNVVFQSKISRQWHGKY